MKIIKALRKWYKRYPLSSSEQNRVNDLFTNIKIAFYTLIIGLAAIWLVSQAGCFTRPVTPEDFAINAQ